MEILPKFFEYLFNNLLEPVLVRSHITENGYSCLLNRNIRFLL